jgi:proteic killer suppression protein
MAIKSFADREAARLFAGHLSRKLPQDLQKRAMMRLSQLDAATELMDLALPPSNQLEPLKGDRKGQHSIRVNRQYRVCFIWRNGNAHEVEIVDYHKAGKS